MPDLFARESEVRLIRLGEHPVAGGLLNRRVLALASRMWISLRMR